MTEDFTDGLGLADAIEMLRNDLLRARMEAIGAQVQLPVESMTVELKVTATRRTDGKAGFKVPFVGAELGGSAGWQEDTVQTVTVVFSEPVDVDGNPVKVAHTTNQIKR